MSLSSNKVLKFFLKNWLPLVAIILVVFVWRRATQVVNAPNLLNDSTFDANELVAWQVLRQGPAVATSKPSEHTSVLELAITDTSEESWVGIGQRANIEPFQRYNVQVKYQLASSNQNTSQLILRVTQFDQTGETLKTEEISPPDLLVARSSDNPQQTDWPLLTHIFTTEEQAATVEIGVGLFSHQVTTVELDSVGLKTDLTLQETLGKDPVILFLVLALVVGVGYKSRWMLNVLGGWVFQSTKARQRLVAIVAVNIILFVVLAELLALGFYFVRQGKLFYLNKPTYDLIETAESSQELTPKRIHPYFGYVDKSGWQRAEDNFWKNIEPRLKTINNHGLGSDYDYPFMKRHDNQYIIGIFGGSVAERFTLLTRDRLIENLQQNDFFADKEIVVLNFAKGGYKQPQQLLLLTYFLSIGQEFDMVINIDGFNEVAFSHRNYQRQVDLSMPHVNILDGLTTLIDQSTLTPEKLESLAQINAYKTRLDTLAEQINNSNLAAVTFVLEQNYTIVFNRYQQELTNFNELDSSFSENSLLFIKPENRILPDPLLFGQIADNWARTSIMMSRTLAAEEIVYFHFLQPNQHYSNKTFGAQEAERALEQGQPYYSTLVKAGYPYLIDKFEILAEQNINFYSGIPVFDKESGMVYIDNCCHYNQLGNDILADFIAASILESGDLDVMQ